MTANSAITRRMTRPGGSARWSSGRRGRRSVEAGALAAARRPDQGGAGDVRRAAQRATTTAQEQHGTAQPSVNDPSQSGRQESNLPRTAQQTVASPPGFGPNQAP